ncbi:MAG: LysM peptidoglycan-binding domain-containing protein [Anaerolineales bacterium]|jgi:LysM repeat protein
MSNKPSFQRYKETRERRQKYGPLIMGGVAIVLVAVGILLIFMWVRGASFSFGPADTPTPTATFTNTPLPPSETPTETLVPTDTLVPTETLIPTPSEPFSYTVQSGDSLISIAEQFNVEYVWIMLLNGLTYESILYAGDQLLIPNPDMGLPTATPLPPNLPRGAIIDYFVLPGDTLMLIAEEYLSTIERIVDENDLEDASSIFPGQVLKVPYYIITPTFGPTETPTPQGTPTPTATVTPEG